MLGVLPHPPGASGSGGSPEAVSVPSCEGRDEEDEDEEGGWVRGAPSPGSSAMCRSSAGKEPRGCSSSTGKTLPWDGTFFKPGLAGGWGGAGLSRLEEELRWLSPSLPGPGRLWKEALRAMPGPVVTVGPVPSRARSTGLGAGLGPGAMPR